ncbi:MAG TPA: SUMF1/EgtB/PvdO family nonheme iron enzyme, partial [Pirellulaceae bacterium]|nr:SUMF1/EgtB/PvdO family nonheme iron enzyme [Pirellulaceae bacterium]
CELLLVPYENAGARVPSFYIMENKVWNQLFAIFNEQHLQTHPDQEGTPAWPDDWQRLGAAKGADDLPADAAPLHPVMRVGYPQSQQFAAWLGGKLPTCQQWDTAAGFYLPLASQRQGPFQGEWKETLADRPEIAVDRVEQGPLPVGTARDDVSPHGVRDLSGNGAEWTRDASSGQFSTIMLRGRRYDKLLPLYYDHLREEKQQLDPQQHNEIDSEDPEATSPYIGFRIVIEP